MSHAVGKTVSRRITVADLCLPAESARTVDPEHINRIKIEVQKGHFSTNVFRMVVCVAPEDAAKSRPVDCCHRGSALKQLVDARAIPQNYEFVVDVLTDDDGRPRYLTTTEWVGLSMQLNDVGDKRASVTLTDTLTSVKLLFDSVWGDHPPPTHAAAQQFLASRTVAALYTNGTVPGDEQARVMGLSTVVLAVWPFLNSPSAWAEFLRITDGRRFFGGYPHKRYSMSMLGKPSFRLPLADLNPALVSPALADAVRVVTLQTAEAWLDLHTGHQEDVQLRDADKTPKLSVPVASDLFSAVSLHVCGMVLCAKDRLSILDDDILDLYGGVVVHPSAAIATPFASFVSQRRRRPLRRHRLLAAHQSCLLTRPSACEHSFVCRWMMGARLSRGAFQASRTTPLCCRNFCRLRARPTERVRGGWHRHVPPFPKTTNQTSPAAA